jgi:hypothetical protein
MTIEPDSRYLQNSDKQGVVNLVDEMLVETIWQDLEGRASHEQIRQLASEVASEFEDATVTTFIPIILQRRARSRFGGPANENS